MAAVIEESKEQVTFGCSYCGGRGRDPFELLSRWSTCYVCRGKLRVQEKKPFLFCPHCDGSGISPQGRYSCIVCHGKGVIHVEESSSICPECDGSGSSIFSGLWCVECKGKGVIF